MRLEMNPKPFLYLLLHIRIEVCSEHPISICKRLCESCLDICVDVSIRGNALRVGNRSKKQHPK